MERTREDDLRLAVILELEKVVTRKASGDLQEKLKVLFWLASTRSGERGRANQAYQEAVRLMQRNGVMTEEEVAGIVDSVDTKMKNGLEARP